MVVFLMAWLIQLFYYLFFFSRLALYRPTFSKAAGIFSADLASATTAATWQQGRNVEKQQCLGGESLPVSVIICAKNEAANLRAFLSFILQQVYPIFEVIVVNDSSTDDSAIVLESLQKQHPRLLRIVDTQEKQRTMAGKKFALSQGIAAAKYEYLLLTDADCRPQSVYWIRQMMSNFNDKTDIVLGYSPYYSSPNSFLNKIIQFETTHTAMQYMSYCLVGLPYMGVGRNVAYRKKNYEQAKGFESHSDLASGDDDLFINQAANCRNCCIEIGQGSFCFSVPPKTWKAWYRQKTRHLSTGNRYKRTHKVLLFIYALSHFLFYGTFIVGLMQAKVVMILYFFLRLTTQFFVFCRLKKKLQLSLSLYEIVLLDFLFAFYPIIFIISTTLKTPNLSWK